MLVLGELVKADSTLVLAYSELVPVVRELGQAGAHLFFILEVA